jgi:uncharacterized protein with PIN domain
MHSAVTRGYWLRATDSRLQVAEILDRFDLAGGLRPFTRCMACNTLLRPADPNQARRRLPARTAERYDEFLECPGCRRVYWQGSHWRRMRRWIEELTHTPAG